MNNEMENLLDSSLDSIILAILLADNCNNGFKSLTIQEILDNMANEGIQAQYRNVHKRLVKLMNNGLIQKGLQKGKSHRYYITEKGQKVFVSVSSMGA